MNKVEESIDNASTASTTTSQAPSSSTSITSATAYNNSKAQQVRMVRIEEDSEVNDCAAEVFDLTELFNDVLADACVGGVERVNMVKVETADEFQDCFEAADEELSKSIPTDVTWVSMNMQDDHDNDSTAHTTCRINMVKDVTGQPVVMTLDSGADVSVAPCHFDGIGEPGAQGHVKMVDAQGELIPTTGNRKLRLTTKTRTGQAVEFVESFAMGNVSHPLMSFGKLMRQGWTVQRDRQGLYIHHAESSLDIPARLERNGLVMDVKVCAAMLEDSKEESSSKETATTNNTQQHQQQQAEQQEALHVFALKGYISSELMKLEVIPGWHVLPNGVVVYSDPVAQNYLDPRDNYNEEWKARMTLMKLPGQEGIWQQIENCPDFRTLENPYEKLVPSQDAQRTLTFLAPRKLKNYFNFNSDVPFSQYPILGDEPAWPSDDEEERDEFAAEGEGEAPGQWDLEIAEDEELQVTLDESTLNMESKLKDMQSWCKKLSLATSGGKMKCLKRLMKYHKQEEQRIALDIAKKLYAEDEHRPVQLAVPKLPSRLDQDLHCLTHLPFASWCQSCVANRAREDQRRKEDGSDKKDRGKSVISFDYGYTYVKGEEEEKQYGTVLYVAESETKALLAIPVMQKGSASLKQVTEEIVRFSMATSSGQSVIFQADGERSTRQILRAVQHCRAQLGLSSEIRITGTGQHASNGQAERAVQTVRNLANCLRYFAEERGGVMIKGSSDVYPWSFRHAAWLITRFRTINGATSFEQMCDRKYAGRVVLFGESVMFKDITSMKGEPTYKKGVWVGKSSWSDSHIVLTSRGAMECRSIRRIPNQFSGFDLVAAKGLPWSYSPQGILMKMKSAPTRTALAVEDTEEGDEEKKALQAGRAVALGLITPGPVGGAITPGGKISGFATPGLPAPTTPATVPAPGTPAGGVPAPTTPSTQTMRGVSSNQDPKEDEAQTRKHGEEAKETSPRKRLKAGSTTEAEMEMTEIVEGELSRKRGPEEEAEDPDGPKRLRRVMADFPDGDEAYEDDIIMAEADEAQEKDDLWLFDDTPPPAVSDEELEELDAKAEEEEEQRLIAMGVLLIPESEDEVKDSYNITTKMVICWKKRQEMGGWFRRARLVARQYKWSVMTDEAFAPTSAYVIFRMLLHLSVMDQSLRIYVADIKDAFLMVDQPPSENATVTRNGKLYKLGKVLPGQRTAASQWFGLFRSKAMAFGMESDVMQPSLMKKKGQTKAKKDRIFLTIHVDDLLVVGDEDEVERFFNYLTEVGWRYEKQGPMEYREKFEYLKRKIHTCNEGIVIRPDEKHVEELVQLCNILGKCPKKTTTSADFNKLSKENDDVPLPEEMQAKYRSVVGKLLYLAPDRPDIQYVTQGLSSFMKSPTKKAWQFAVHLVSYLMGTMDEGILLEAAHIGRSMMNVTGAAGHADISEDSDEENKQTTEHLLEVVCDADYAGNQRDRKSLSSVQIYLDGNLLESYVRSQKSIALSSGEAEYVCMVGGASEAMFLQHCWFFLSGKQCKVICRSDSSAARSLASRLGIGKIRHLAASMLWLQEKVANKVIEITAIPTELNPADAGTKSLSKARLLGLKRMMRMVDHFDEPIGTEQYMEIQEKERARKEAKSVAKRMGGNAKVAIVVAMTLLEKGKGESIQDGLQMTPYIEEKPYQPLGYVTFLMLVGLALIGALSLAAGLVWYGPMAVSKIAGWIKDATSSEVRILRKKCHEQSAKIKFLEEKMVKLKTEADASIQAHKKALRDKDITHAQAMSNKDREVQEARRNSRVPPGFITADQVLRMSEKFLDFKVTCTGLGECYHDQNCRFVRPPMSNSARTLRPCGECMQAAVRGVLNQA